MPSYLFDCFFILQSVKNLLPYFVKLSFLKIFERSRTKVQIGAFITAKKCIIENNVGKGVILTASECYEGSIEMNMK